MNDKIFKRYCYLVKQSDTNWPYLTARETLVYAAELYNVTTGNDDTRLLVEDVMRKTGLESAADTKCVLLSGGQQRRLSLAVALLKQPAVLFLDEPTSGLDAASATAIMGEITRVAKEERLVILCTIHQPSTKVYNGFDQGKKQHATQTQVVMTVACSAESRRETPWCAPPISTYLCSFFHMLILL